MSSGQRVCRPHACAGGCGWWLRLVAAACGPRVWCTACSNMGAAAVCVAAAALPCVIAAHKHSWPGHKHGGLIFPLIPEPSLTSLSHARPTGLFTLSRRAHAQISADIVHSHAAHLPLGGGPKLGQNQKPKMLSTRRDQNRAGTIRATPSTGGPQYT